MTVSPPTTAQQLRRRQRNIRLTAALLAAMVVAVFALGFWHQYEESRAHATPRVTAP